MRERDHDIELLAKQAAQLVLRLGQPARGERGALSVERMRLALRQRGELRHAVERDRRQALLRPDGLNLVERPDEVWSPVERLHQVGGGLERTLFAVVRPEVDLGELAPALGGWEDRRLLDRAQRALRERRERPDLLDLVAEELDTERFAAGGREHVDETAADCELAPFLDPLDALVAGGRKLFGECIDPGLVAGRDANNRCPLAGRRNTFRHRRRGCADETAAVEHSKSTRTLTDEMRRWLQPRSPVDAARREQRHVLVAEEPARGLGRVACVGVLGQHDHETALQLVVQSSQNERQHRLRDAGARRQRCGELLEPLLCAEAFDEAVENGPVHDDGPNRAFGRVVIVRGQTSLRAPS